MCRAIGPRKEPQMRKQKLNIKAYYLPQNMRAISVMHEIEGRGEKAYDAYGNVVMLLDVSKSFHKELNQFACKLNQKYAGFRSVEKAKQGYFILFDGQGREWKNIEVK